MVSFIKLNRKFIAYILGKTIGHASQVLVMYKLLQALNLEPKRFILLRTSVKFLWKILGYYSFKYQRLDFSDETIFSDAIDASFDVY